MTRHYTTDLRCGACVASIALHFDGDAAVATWTVDLATPKKVLTVDGLATRAHIELLLGRAGYRVLEEVTTVAPAASVTIEPPRSYFPLVLILVYLLLVVGVGEAVAGGFDLMRAMGRFMAGFFLVFSFFKLLDVWAFADAYAMYDLLAARSRVYALAYPFLELGLGLAYLAGVWPQVTNAATLGLMLLGAAGILHSLRRKRAIRCACLGAVFNLPMSAVTLTEDVLMAAMAAVMLFV